MILSFPSGWGAVDVDTAPATMAIRKATMLLTVVGLSLGAAAQDQSDFPIFYYPPNSGSELIFNKMDTVIVSYQAFYDTVDFYTFCEPGVGKLSGFSFPKLSSRPVERARH
jgi:hypothetical protein